MTLARGRSYGDRRRAHVVDYRHVIHSLRRKPGALLNLTYRDQLFPRTAYRRSWDALLAALPAQTACQTMVGLLALAHDRACFTPRPAAPPDIAVPLPDIATYDALLAAGAAA